jgi:hypothetical protein
VSQLIFLTKYYEGDQFKKDEIGGHVARTRVYLKSFRTESIKKYSLTFGIAR